MEVVSVGKVIDIINTIIKDTKITANELDADLTELGMESITFIQIIVAIEETFECEIPDSKLLITEMETVNKIIAVLQTIYDESNA